MTARTFPSVRSLSLALAAAVLVMPPASPAAAAPRVHTVVIDKLKFGPVPAGIRVGDTILWVNKDFLKHTATRARQELQHRIAAEHRREDPDQPFGLHRLLLHLSSRNDGFAERREMIGPKDADHFET